MTIEEYKDAVKAVAVAAGILRAHDLPALIQAIERADAVGPILDPTLYRDKARAMSEDRAMLEAALPLWRLGAKLWPGGEP